MAKGDFYFPLFYQRFLTSTTGWTDEEVGAYIRLLIYQFDNGSIPASMKELSRIAISVKKNWKILSKKFTPDGQGNLINLTMQEIREEITKKREINILNGKKGGRPKNRTVNRMVNPEPNPNHKPNETIPLTINQDIVSNSIIAAAGGISEIANRVWKNQKWRDDICCGLSLSTEQLKKWLSQFNASLSDDPVIAGMTESRYKKMARGWISKQQSKGYKVETMEKKSDAPSLKVVYGN